MTGAGYVRDIEKELYAYQNTGLTIEDVTSLKEKFDQSTAETQRLLEKLTELKDSCDYWEREAKKWCNKLGEIRGMVERSEL